MEKTENISIVTRTMARFCERFCPVCRKARKDQAGLAFLFVKNVETGFCPFCKAYEKLHGLPAHASID